MKIEGEEANGHANDIETDGAEAVNGDAEEKEAEDDDPNRIPDNACETLYLQNLNEKVRTTGKSTKSSLLHCLPGQFG